MLFKVKTHAAMRVAGILGLSILSSCGKFQSSDQNLGADDVALPARNLGCIQGVVIDGLTGTPVSIDEKSRGAPGRGIRTMVGGVPIGAQTVARSFDGSKEFTGEYSVCNIPLDETYPLIVSLDGYQKVEGLFEIASTIPPRTEKKDAPEIVKRVPTEIVNIKVYPIGVETSDLRFRVVYQGKPQVGARVQLVTTGNLLDDNSFLAPSPMTIRALPYNLETDGNGFAVFPANTLVLGAKLKYRVFPKNSYNSVGLAEGSVVIGVASGPDKQNYPNDIVVDLNQVYPALKLVSSSIDDNHYTNSGELRLVYNRPVKFYQDDEVDLVRATLSDVVYARLKQNVPGNNVSEQVDVRIEGNMVILTPKFEVAPVEADEGGAKIRFSGLHLTVADQESVGLDVQVPEMTVPLFPGRTDVPLPRFLKRVSGAISGTANSDVQGTVSVQLLDQKQRPYKLPAQVTIEASSGNGTVRAPGNTGSGSSTLTLNVSETGTVDFVWRLGSTSVKQVITVRSSGVDPLVIEAAVADVVSGVRFLRSSFSAPALREFGEPIEVEVINQNGAVFAGANAVVFSVESGSSGMIRDVLASSYSTAPLTLRTASSGRAQIIWKLGKSSETNVLRATVNGFSARLTATATLVPASIVSDAWTAGARATINRAYQLKIIVRDQEAHVLSGQRVSFRLLKGEGRLALPGSTSSVVNLIAMTDSNGIATVEFTPTNIGVFEIEAAQDTLTTTASFVGEAIRPSL